MDIAKNDKMWIVQQMFHLMYKVIWSEIKKKDEVANVDGVKQSW